MDSTVHYPIAYKSSPDATEEAGFVSKHIFNEALSSIHQEERCEVNETCIQNSTYKFGISGKTVLGLNVRTRKFTFQKCFPLTDSSKQT